jgi:GYF domain 2
MKFHVAREGAVMGEFEEQIFRNKVFSGEIRPNDFYWTAGFADWRPVSEFRVARKTEPIVLDTGSAVPPAIVKARQRSAPAIALICICALVLLIGVAMIAGKSKPGRVPQHRRVEGEGGDRSGSASNRDDGGSMHHDARPAGTNRTNQRIEKRAVDVQSSRRTGHSSL